MSSTTLAPTGASSTGVAPAAPAPNRRWWTLVTVALAQLMVVLDSTVVNIALPSAQADLGFTNGDRQWVVTAYSLAFGSLLLLGGRLSDLIGRKRTFIIGLVGFAAASALGGAATTFGMLVGARALQGAFAALLAPTALAVLTTTFVIPKERARAFGVFGAIAGAGGAFGLLLGGFLTQDFSWRWNLYINVAIAVVAVIGATIFVSSVERTGPRPKLDLPGTVLVSGGLFALVYGFSHAETDGWSSTLTWAMLVASGVLLIAFGLWQRRASHPLLPLSIIVDRNRGAAYSSVLIAGAGMFGIFLFVTYYLQTSLGYSPIKTGLSFLPMIGMLILAAQLSTNLFVPRLGPKIMVPFGMALAAGGMLYLTHLDLQSTYAADILPPLMILGFGMGSIMPASMQTATLGVDRQFAGVASAMVNTSQQVGGSVGTALLNTLAASSATAYVAAHLPPSAGVVARAAVHSYATAYVWGAGFFVFGGLLAALVFRRRGDGLSLSHAAPSTAARAETDREPDGLVAASPSSTGAGSGQPVLAEVDHTAPQALRSIPVAFDADALDDPDERLSAAALDVLTAAQDQARQHLAASTVGSSSVVQRIDRAGREVDAAVTRFHAELDQIKSQLSGAAPSAGDESEAADSLRSYEYGLLLNAQQTADRVTRIARLEAERILANAESEAAQLDRRIVELRRVEAELASQVSEELRRRSA